MAIGKVSLPTRLSPFVLRPLLYVLCLPLLELKTIPWSERMSTFHTSTGTRNVAPMYCFALKMASEDPRTRSSALRVASLLCWQLRTYQYTIKKYLKDSAKRFLLPVATSYSGTRLLVFLGDSCSLFRSTIKDTVTNTKPDAVEGA